MSEGARPLAGRPAIVTGASRGIGLAVARALAAAGAPVAMLARSRVALERAAATLPAAVALPCDVSDERAVERVAAALPAALGGAPEIVVNSAGVFTLAPVAETAPDDFRRALEVNLVGPFVVVRAFLGPMRAAGRGDVVTIGSVADRATFPENGAYAASKFGLRALHQVLRAELRGSGVRAALVSPGPVDTALWDAVDPDARAGFTPRARMLRPEDVADAVLWVLTRPRHVDVDELRLAPA